MPGWGKADYSHVTLPLVNLLPDYCLKKIGRGSSVAAPRGPNRQVVGE
jgi:hypothetical protein